MTLEEISTYIENKINKDPNLLIFTFYEIRIKLDLSEQETDKFLKLTRTKLENLGYRVYFTGAKYEYKNQNKVVQDNELMIAIKEGD